MTHLPMLLAQRANWERLGDRFSGKSAEVNPWELFVLLLAMAGAGLLIWLLHRVAKWQEGRVRKPNPRRLFNELCRTHRLGGWERRALRALAEGLGAQQPAEVFLRPEAFELEALPEMASGRPAALEKLRRKLFPELT